MARKPLSAEHKAKISAALKGRSRGGKKKGGLKPKSTKSPLAAAARKAKAAADKKKRILAKGKIRARLFNKEREVSKATRLSKRGKVQR